jgi:YfiH family protein
VEHRALPGDIRALVSSELERRGFLAAFTERTGGSSQGPYSSLNLGAETGDVPAAVAENRGRLTEVLGVGELTMARQVHGTGVVRVERAGQDLAAADALVTSIRSVPLAIMTADCVPLALASERDGRLAAVHIGWRGLASGLVQIAVGLFGAPTEVVAAIGPAIGPCHYDVGPEVVEAVRHGTEGLARVEWAEGRSRLDIPATVESLLRRAGLAAVDRAKACTACEPLRFFSHRRDGTTGRQALVAVRL